MSGAGQDADRDLPGWIADELEVQAGARSIGNVDHVRSLLIAAARDGRSISYSELLGALGHRFTRPKMRALCKTLDAVDRAGMEAGEPPLAVLVVRESDRLPGQGWWVSVAAASGYAGAWQGSEAAAFVAAWQQRAFDWWRATRQ